MKIKDELSHIPAASRITIAALDEDIKNLKKGLKNVETQIKVAKKANIKGDKFVEIMEDFKQKADVQLKEIDEDWEKMISSLKELAVLFNEEEQTLLKEPDKFFGDISHFLNLFSLAHDANVKAKEDKIKKEKLAAKQKKEEEERRKRREQREKEKLQSKQRHAVEGRGAMEDRGEELKKGTILRKKAKNRKKLTRGAFDDSFSLKSGQRLDSNMLNAMF